MPVAVNFTIMSDEGTPAPVDGVEVLVYNDVGLFVAQGETGVVTPGSGQVELTLDGSAGGTSYFVRLAKAGWSPDPEGPYTALVYDPVGAPPQDNNFEYTMAEGATAVVVTIAVDNDLPTPVPVEDVRVRLYDAGDSFLAEGDTNASGEVEFPLVGSADPGTEYIVRLIKAGHSFPSGATQLIRVLDPVAPPQSNIFDITAHVRVLPEASDPNMCLISGTMVDNAFRPLKDYALRFIPQRVEPTAYVGGVPHASSPSVIEGNILADEVTFRTDDTGYVEILLPRNSYFSLRTYSLESVGFRVGLEQLDQIHVPDAAAVKLADILFPYVVSMSFDPASVAVDVGEESSVLVEAISSDGQTIANQSFLANLLLFESSDEDVATVEVGPDGIVITGVAAGSAEISVQRIETTVPTVIPALPDLSFTALPVTVS